MNILSVLDCHTQAQAKKTACVFLQEGEEETESISYVQLTQSVDAAAHVLGAHLAPGQRVLLALPDGIDFIIAFLACLRAGLVAVPVKPAQNPEATGATFRARIAGEGDRCYLRTGDLGFMLGEELFITGRIKELMVFNGTNHYPQDVEEAAAGCHPALSLGRSVAFSVPGPVSESLVRVQEINRDPARQFSAALASEIAGALKSTIYSRHAIPTGEVVLVRLNSIPRTTSGKLCRVSCKKRYLAAALDVLPLMPVANAAEAAL